MKFRLLSVLLFTFVLINSVTIGAAQRQELADSLEPDDGLVSDTEWVAPLSGISVTWDAEFLGIDPTNTDAIRIIETDGIETIQLGVAGTPSNVDVLITKIDFDPRDSIEKNWSDPDFHPDDHTLQSVLTEGDRVEIISLVEGGGVDYVELLTSVSISEQEWIAVQLFAETQLFLDVYEATVQGLEIDGSAISFLHSPSEVESVLVEAGALATVEAAETPVVESDDDSELSIFYPEEWGENGLVSDNEWVSPAFGTSISWSGFDFAFDISVENSVHSSATGNHDALTLYSLLGNGFTNFQLTDVTAPVDVTEEYWLSDEFVDSYPEEITVLHVDSEGDKAVVIIDGEDSAGREFQMIITGIWQENDSILYVQVRAYDGNVVGLYSDMLETFEVDGGPVPVMYTVKELEAILD